MITKSAGATTLTGPDVDRFALLSLKGALYLETKGMGRRGQSAYSIVKQRYGLKGTKQQVYEQFESYVTEQVKPNLGRDDVPAEPVLCRRSPDDLGWRKS